MIEEIVRILQRIASIWLALSVIYPAANNKIMASAQRNHPRGYYRVSSAAGQPARLMQPALAALALTITDILFSIL